ncbi:MAG: NAD(P)H-dependent oxidoreductase [Saprospiraceae bacterium]|nr:NAD(P)H-dependent oxidoreductase [Saprospiraceae bacterium]
MDFIKNLEWRYATKKFDTQKKVSTEDLEKIKEAIQLSASSYGLQLYKVLIIEDQATREKLKPASWGQPQITDASHLLVFCNYAKVSDDQIDEFIELKSKVQGIPINAIKGYGEFIKGKLAEKSSVEVDHWTARQTYIALGNLLAACAELKIDACPMEGFEPEMYNEILGLTEKGLSAAVVATVGYRSEEDQTQHAKKVRKPMDSLFEVK